MCGASLFARARGDLTCVTHGHFVSAQSLDATFGMGASENVRRMTARATLTPRKCPDDRYEMSFLANASGSVQADACARCGALWIPLATIEGAQARSPPQKELPMSEARSLYAFACAQALVAKPPAAPQRR
jgi:hypothetical protein